MFAYHFQSFSTLMTFIACMMIFPEAQHRGQHEIDRVVGNSRLPDFSDRDSLPFVEAVFWETLR